MMRNRQIPQHYGSLFNQDLISYNIHKIYIFLNKKIGKSIKFCS